MSSRRSRVSFWGGFRVGWVLVALGVLGAYAAFSYVEGHAFVRLGRESLLFFWQDAQATLHLRLGCPDSPLPHWGPCWDDAARDAATRWNNVAAEFRFSTASPSIPVDPCTDAPDGVNTTSFQDTLCGRAFGDALAVTISFANPATGTLIDSDTLFDAGRRWSTYPGPLQPGTPDFHRVAIHEFGHVLGLAHPDDFGQNVLAIMNSRVSEVDALQPDDIAGVNAIYPAVSAVSGFLDSPQPAAFVSGIGLIFGWVCTASRVDIAIDNVTMRAAYGTSRPDTIGVCGDEQNGFSLLFNWNRLGDGIHTVTARADGKEIGRARVTVTTFGQEFLSGASGAYLLPDFAGRDVVVEWDQSLQNFVIREVR